MSTAIPLELPPPVQQIPSDILWEEINGRVVEKYVGAKEIDLANDLAFLIKQVAKPGKLGRTHVEMVFDWMKLVGHKRRPNVAFVSFNRWASDVDLPLGTDWIVVPDLAVEIVSPSNSYADIVEKKNEYFQVGVTQVWIVVPSAREIHVYESATDMRIVSGADTLSAKSLLPGFELPLTELFGTAN
ncbi:MAG: Uma2 family endonuclease [Planctomycetota bacterium]|nr:Uma2 family endonuclease [Planctomycetota bacterium]